LGKAQNVNFSGTRIKQYYQSEKNRNLIIFKKIKS